MNGKLIAIIAIAAVVIIGFVAIMLGAHPVTTPSVMTGNG